MNNLKLKLNPYKDMNIASLDDKALSPYSELNNYIKEPFLKWADKLLDAAERELNDDFRLVVIGEEFETKFLLDMQCEFDSCISYENEQYQINYSVNERFEIIQELANKYSLTVQTDNYRLPVYSDVVISIPQESTVQATIENAFLYITNNRDTINLISNENGAKMIVLVSNQSKVTSLGNMKYIWEIEEHRLNEIVNLVIERFVKVPLIIEIAKQLETKKTQMSSDDYEKLAMATEIDMLIFVEDLADIEVGKVVAPVYKTLPAKQTLPALRIVTSNPNVLRVEGNYLKAVAAGQTIVEFYKAEEIIPFARKEAIIYQDNFVQKIYLSLIDKQMGIGKCQVASITLVPEDAADAKQIKWSVDNESILRVQNNGEVIAMLAGKATITAETTKAKQAIEVEVLPNISDIKLSINAVHCYVGQTRNIQVSVTPSNCFNKEYEWKSSDRNVAIVEKLDDGCEIVRATGIGNCVLTCKAKEGDCQATCSVEVESTFKKRENIHTWLSATAACLVVFLFCSGFSFAMGYIAAAVATVVCGIIAMAKNKSDRFWALLLMCIAIFVLLAETGLLQVIQGVFYGN